MKSVDPWLNFVIDMWNTVITVLFSATSKSKALFSNCIIPSVKLLIVLHSFAITKQQNNVNLKEIQTDQLLAEQNSASIQKRTKWYFAAYLHMNHITC